MAEYINREDLLCLWHYDDFDKPVIDVADLDLIAPADVVEVVRCKDCKWCHSGYCEMYDDLIPFGCANRPWEEWFCADGAKMDGDS